MLRQSELITTMEGAISGELIHYGGLQLPVRCGAICLIALSVALALPQALRPNAQVRMRAGSS